MSVKWDNTEEGTVMIRQTAVFDLKSLPILLREWGLENNYRYIEKDFTEKVKGDGREYTIKYEFRRKVTPFVRYIINVDIWCLRVNDVKVKDKVLQKGRFEAIFESTIEFDWQEQWESNPIFKFFRHLYIYYIKKQFFLNFSNRLWSEVYELHAKLKAHLHQLTFEFQR